MKKIIVDSSHYIMQQNENRKEFIELLLSHSENIILKNSNGKIHLHYTAKIIIMKKPNFLYLHGAKL